MFSKSLTIVVAAALLADRGRAADSPAIRSIDGAGQIIWTNTVAGTITVIQQSTNLDVTSWESFWYDLANVGLHSNRLPATAKMSSFYRLAIQTNFPDPSLVLYLPFDNDFTDTGIMLDASGYGNHGLRYSLTSWPSPAVGPDGRVAGEFHRMGTFQGGGDYAGVPWTTNAPFHRLTNGTLLVWAHYNANSYHASAIIDGSSYSIFPYSWFLGRDYSSATAFNVYDTNGNTLLVVVYPDLSSGDTGGWHHYGVTWDGTNFIGYFDGLPISTNSQAGVPALILGGSATAQWIAIGCRTHNGTPQIDGDGLPNNGWFSGEIDDVKLHSRALSAKEISALYYSFDKLPPTTPTNLGGRAISTNMIELRWSVPADLFGIRGYQVLRDGEPAGIVQGTLFLDFGLMPGRTYTYSVRAFDPGANYSTESTKLSLATPSTNIEIEIVLDNADGGPWIGIIGAWQQRTNNAGQWGSDYLRDANTGKGTKSVIFQPLLPEAGDYRVYIRYPSQSLVATNTPVDVVQQGPGGGTNTILINEQRNGSRWNLLGSYSFKAGTNAFVRIRTDGTTDYVIADAVRFVK